MGEPDVDAMLGRMTSRQVAEWMAYNQIEPFGEERADLRAGIVASTIANVNRGKGQPMKPADFMPKFDRRETDQDPNLMKAMFQRFKAYAAKATGR